MDLATLVLALLAIAALVAYCVWHDMKSGCEDGEAAWSAGEEPRGQAGRAVVGSYPIKCRRGHEAVAIIWADGRVEVACPTCAATSFPASQQHRLQGCGKPHPWKTPSRSCPWMKSPLPWKRRCHTPGPPAPVLDQGGFRPEWAGSSLGAGKRS